MKELKEYYQKKIAEVCNTLIEYNSNVEFINKATNPFCMEVPEKFSLSKNRIIMYGQETNSWCSECGVNGEFSNSLEKSLRVYEKFFLNGGIDNYSGPFWNEFKRIKRRFQDIHGTFFLWNNVNKIGRIGKGFVNEINLIQFNKFLILEKEIEILKPNILVFLTGHKYDIFINKNLGEFSQTEIDDCIWELNFTNPKLRGIKAFKTFHPNSLYFKSKNKTVIPNLMKFIEKSCV